MPDERRADVTDDAVLGGRLRLLQPVRGHRFGHDAILLAAATDAKSGQRVVDFGAGVGAAGLALAARISGVDVTLVEIDPHLAALAEENIRRTGLNERARVAMLDIGVGAHAYLKAGLQPASAQRVMMNPPFNDPARQNVSPDPRRRRAHLATSNGLRIWVDAAHRLLGSGDVLTLIWRAEKLTEVLAMLSTQFGGLAILPVHPRPEEPAIRVLVRAVKGSRAPLTLLPGLVLNDETGRPTAAAEAILRGGAALPISAL